MCILWIWLSARSNRIITWTELHLLLELLSSLKLGEADHLFPLCTFKILRNFLNQCFGVQKSAGLRRKRRKKKLNFRGWVLTDLRFGLFSAPISSNMSGGEMIVNSLHSSMTFWKSWHCLETVSRLFIKDYCLSTLFSFVLFGGPLQDTVLIQRTASSTVLVWEVTSSYA